MSIVTDASGLGIGGVLQVLRGSAWEVAAFVSRQTRGAEQWYSATELEALALVETIKHFGYYLYGKEFVAFTDHKPLCHLLSSDHLNGRLRRLRMKLQHWLVEIRYVPGENNSLADALSREERRCETDSKDDVSLVSGDVGERPQREVSVQETRKEVPGTKIAKQGNNELSSSVIYVHMELGRRPTLLFVSAHSGGDWL